MHISPRPNTRYRIQELSSIMLNRIGTCAVFQNRIVAIYEDSKALDISR